MVSESVVCSDGVADGGLSCALHCTALRTMADPDGSRQEDGERATLLSPLHVPDSASFSRQSTVTSQVRRWFQNISVVSIPHVGFGMPSA